MPTTMADPNTGDTTTAAAGSLAAHYSRLLADGVERTSLQRTLGEATAPDLSSPAIKDRVERARAQLRRIVRDYLGNKHELLELADSIAEQGREALIAVAEGDDDRLRAAGRLKTLEVIVRSDGSRPSFLVRDDEVDRASSPLGSWGPALDDSEKLLRGAVECVGRIDDGAADQGFIGTGFLVGQDTIITNRHVLQEIAKESDDGWKLRSGIAIDFGHEFKGHKTVRRHKLNAVLFAGSKPIPPNRVDHRLLDLAVIRLAPSRQGARAVLRSGGLAVDAAPEWAMAGQTIYTIGYPGSPLIGSEPFSLLEELFQSLFGFKRLAPGRVMKPHARTAKWGVAHDATTLGGNSGSVILVAGREGIAAALHYGGSPAEPRENWGHVLGAVLDAVDTHTGQTLRECFAANDIRLVDRRTSDTHSSTPNGREKITASPVSPRHDGRGVHVNLERIATLETMIRLDGGAGLTELLEKAGKEGMSTEDEFDGREGYDPEFLEGWSIPLPKPVGRSAKDVRELRRGGEGSELKYQNFSVVLSKSRRMPMFTACNIDGEQSRSLPRIQTWKYDGRLDATDQWGDSLYDQNLLDRGHMVRREDPVWGTLKLARLANADTFHFTNSCPQMAGVNQKTWLGLENYVLNHARTDRMRVTVFTGPFFTDKDLPYRGALVPLSFWKVVAIVTDDGRPSATAYKVSQEKELQDLEFVYAGYKTYQISIQQITDATSIEFGDLVKYDGFSQHERATGTQGLEEKLESLDQIRV